MRKPKYVGDKSCWLQPERSQKHTQHRQQVPFPNHFFCVALCRPSPSCLLHGTLCLIICFQSHVLHSKTVVCTIYVSSCGRTSDSRVSQSTIISDMFVVFLSPLCTQLLVTQPCPQRPRLSRLAKQTYLCFFVVCLMFNASII